MNKNKPNRSTYNDNNDSFNQIITMKISCTNSKYDQNSSWSVKSMD